MEQENQVDLKPEGTETDDVGVEVSLENEPQKKVEEKSPQEQKPESDVHFKNKVFAQERIISRQQREIDDMKRRLDMVQIPPQPVVEEVIYDLDKEVQVDWKSAVTKLADKVFEKHYNAEKQKLEEQRRIEQSNIKLEENSKLVLNKHSELSDETSEKTQIWRDILAQHPERVTSPDGPLLTMYEMENELRKRGYDIDGVSEKIGKEKVRIANASASSLPSSRPADSNKIVLTKEQKEFCDENGISYERYARSLKKISGGGVEL